MNFTILRAGHMIGPFEQAEIEEMITRDEIALTDLAQLGDVPMWVPLRQLLDRQRRTKSDLDVVRAWAARFWTSLLVRPLPVGLKCLAAGGVLLLVAHWPFLLFGPPFVAALFAGAVLVNERKFAPGLALCAGAVFLPALLLTLLHREPSAGSPEPENTSLPAPVIQSVTRPPAASAPTATPPPESFGGLALPRPVRPTPPPKPAPPM
jgi:hypothetical protein